MKHSISTGLDKATGKKVIDKAMEQYLSRFSDYSPRFAWSSEDAGEFGFSAKGMSLKGKISIAEGKIEFDMDVPFLLKPFQGKAQTIISEQVTKWVEKAKAGEL